MNIKKALDMACSKIAPASSIQMVPIAVEPGAVPNTCFGNVRDKISRDGGSQQLGWAFQHIPETGLLVAIHHAVWVSPAGDLLDITPHEAREAVILEQGQILFLPDESATLLNDGSLLSGLARPNKAFPLSRNKKLQTLARRFNRSEWDYWTNAKKTMAKTGM